MARDAPGLRRSNYKTAAVPLVSGWLALHPIYIDVRSSPSLEREMVLASALGGADLRQNAVVEWRIYKSLATGEITCASFQRATRRVCGRGAIVVDTTIRFCTV
jgi:hypothetical protein